MQEKVDILFVNPGNRLEQFAKLSDLATTAQPLGIAMIASFVRRHGFSVAIIDAEVNGWTPNEAIKEIEKYDPLLLGLSAFTTKMTAAGKILDLVHERMPGVKTMVGGHHCSAIPERTLQEETVDFVIKGEGFLPTLELIKCLKEGQKVHDIPGVWYNDNGVVVNNGRAKGIDNINDLPLAAWDLLPMDKYRAHHWQAWDYGLDQSGFALIFTSLGCPFNCEYCSVNVVYGEHSTRYKSPARVVSEIRHLVEEYNVKHIEIIDDIFTLDQKRTGAVCDAIIASNLGNKVNMWCFARTDRVDKSLMNKMKKAGINWVFMGFESGDDIVLQGVNKKQTVMQIKEAASIVHKAGIHIGGNYVFGLPQDTNETMRQTLDLAKELNTEYANFFLLMAYPGTKLRDMAEAKGYSLPEKWGQYGFFAPDALPMQNDNLTSEEILRFRDKAFTEYFDRPQYLDMINDKFGSEAREFLRKKVLSKKIIRTRYSN